MNTLHKNRLAQETSPYLLQHADNPVDWYPWGDEAINRAQTENKPILLSIGYAACHWCHVMEHESFEDPETAKIMNNLFICIKVDREERPDIDQIYMNFVQMSTGNGGWPLNVFLTPDLMPFFGGTYFPPEERYGRASWKKVLLTISDFYHNRKTELNQNLALIRDAFEKNLNRMPSGDIPDKSIIPSAAQSLSQMYDPLFGGFGKAPKFPPVQPLLLFLRIYHKNSNREFLDMVSFTLRKMAEGGLYDQLGGGFARYSVDDKWLVPHFEKMLYDNALLVNLYLETYLITRNIFYLRVAEETLAFIDREMRSSEGGFYSSLDADSEGEEGKFYLWSKKEIDEVLGENSPIFCDYYAVSESGNFEGKNILHIQSDIATTAARFKKPVEFVTTIIDESRQKLLAMREKRIRPGLDDKILTSWNALMLSAYARAYQITNKSRYAEIIRTGIRFLKSNLFTTNGLLRTYNQGQAKYSAYIEDYSYLIQALLDSYEAIFEPDYLDWAHSLMIQTDAKFWDAKNGGYFMADNLQKHLIYRLKDEHDQSVPSGSAVMLMNHLRFYSLTENPVNIKRAEKLLNLYGSSMSGNPYQYTSYLLALDFYLEKPKEIVVVLPPNHDDTFIREISNIYLPNRVIIKLDTRNRSKVLSAALFEGKTAVNEHPTAYICHNYACSPPVQTITEILNLLQN